MKTTAQNIADACETSLSAVSRAFRADGVVSPALRSKILNEAARQGYSPPTRRAGKGFGTISFGLVVGDIENPFYPHVLRQFSSSAAALGWEMTVIIAPKRGSVDSLISQVLSAKIDVVVIASAELSSDLAAKCRNRALPVVMFNRVQAHADMTAVCTDNYGGGVIAGNRLLANGCQRVAFVGGRSETSTHLERRRGLLDALAAKGATLFADTEGKFEYEAALKIGRGFFRKTHPPDGIFCGNDIMGLAVIDAAYEAGLQPGTDVAIIGFDDVPMASWSRYQLTTISQQIPNMVSQAIKSIRRVAPSGNTEGDIVIVPAKLVIRSSG